MDEALSLVPESLACASGCSYCCYYHVYVYPVEVFALRDFILTLRQDEQAPIRSRLVENAAKASALTRDEHIATNIRCALLGDGGRCLAYGVRPTACRQHHSIDGVSCKVTFENPSSSMLNMLSAQRVAVAGQYMESLVHDAVASGFDTLRYEMNGALNEALSNPACHGRWKHGKVTFPSVKDRASPL
jgi:Fe-S-cluster containining protein